MTKALFESLFDDASAWQVCASGQAEGRVEKITGPDGATGLRLHYDFHGGGGFVVIRRVYQLTLPTTFAWGYQLRGEGPHNHFECKVASPGGFNVWRYLRQDFAMPAEWQPIIMHERDMVFAWGPNGGGAPSEIEAIEFVIAAGPGGKGHLDLAAAYLLDQTLRSPAAIGASSESPEHPARVVFSDDAAEWRAQSGDKEPWWSIDFGRDQRFGGLIIHWPSDLPPRAYRLEISSDGLAWQTLYQAQRAMGRLSHIPTPAAEARYVRLVFETAACAGLRYIAWQPDAFSQTPNEFIHSVARDFPRGWHPRYWHREQSYWTPVGSPEGKRRALINEEGVVEVDEGGFSFEPFLLSATGLLTWADMKIQVGLAAGGVPLPSVTWSQENFSLEILPWVDGTADALTLHVRYRLQMRNPRAVDSLAIAIRPFQVNPPWQAFRNLGGVSPIRDINLEDTHAHINDRLIRFQPIASQSGAARFEEGGVLAYLAEGKIPPSHRTTDPSERASAVLVWNIPASATEYEVTVSMPYFSQEQTPIITTHEAMMSEWEKTLGTVEWNVPSCAADAFDCWRTCAGHILINRDGPAIQPGPRRYTRSWVRDCVIMGAALAKVGLPNPLRVFLEWYASFQREDGFIPCVVDRDGVDWLVEHDSHGQFLWGIREVYLHQHDAGFLAKHLPHARKAAEYLLQIRKERMTDFYRSDEQLSRYGLLPESASHEGYLAHPVHSYWDDFWGIRGLQACADICEWLGEETDAMRWRAEAAAFEADVLRSVQRVIAEKKLTYIPGSVEWADFDPTATSNAIAMLDFADALPPEPLETMLASYLDGFHRKHRGEMPWNNYTAYEIRIIGAFVRLGNRETAQELLEFFLSDRRPCEWNQWPEITWRDPRSPGHLGDVPHTWIAAEYIIALTSMVAAERDASHSLVLASGLPWSWIATDEGFSVRHLPTTYGTLAMKLSANDHHVITVEVGDGLAMPPGGLHLRPPMPAGMSIQSINIELGQASLDLEKVDSLEIHQLPLRAQLRLHGSVEKLL